MNPFSPSMDHPVRYRDSSDSSDTSSLMSSLKLNGSPPSSGSPITNVITTADMPKAVANDVDRACGGRTTSGQAYCGRNAQNPWLVNNPAVASNSGLSMYKNHLSIPAGTSGPSSAGLIDLPRMVITERHLQLATSYALYRGNGQYTRLIAADELPPIQGLETTQRSDGLVILPTLNQKPLGPLKFYAQQPFPLTSPTASPNPSAIQYEIDHIVSTARSQTTNSSQPHRKEKVYCDKWVHDGVCAFSQQGCKYKHEMPLDIPTQRSLGLFHGLPTWYKREHNLELRTSREVDGKVDCVATKVKEGLRTEFPAMPPATLPSWRPELGNLRNNAPRRKPALIGDQEASATTQVQEDSYAIPPSCNVFGNIARPAQGALSKNASSSNGTGIVSSIHAPAATKLANGSHTPHLHPHPRSSFGKQDITNISHPLRRPQGNFTYPAATTADDGRNLLTSSDVESIEGDGGTIVCGGNTYDLLSAFDKRG